MTYMRGTHNLVNPDLPIFIVESPSIYQKPAGFSGSWHFMELGVIRSYMGTFPTMLKNSYMAVSCDLWGDRAFFNSLHPNCKFEQARRLADLADAVIYGETPLDQATGPVFESVKIANDRKSARVTFRNVGEGLKTVDGATTVMGFVSFAANSFGLNKTVKPLSATILDPHIVEITFDTAIKAVAYNFDSEDFFDETLTLCNSYGTPSAAFLTPYTNDESPVIAHQDLLSYYDRSVGSKGKSVDTLTVDGTAIFSAGNIESKLAKPRFPQEARS